MVSDTVCCTTVMIHLTLSHQTQYPAQSSSHHKQSAYVVPHMHHMHHHHHLHTTHVIMLTWPSSTLTKEPLTHAPAPPSPPPVPLQQQLHLYGGSRQPQGLTCQPVPPGAAGAAVHQRPGVRGLHGQVSQGHHGGCLRLSTAAVMHPCDTPSEYRAVML
jgi:hypothetical protein